MSMWHRRMYANRVGTDSTRSTEMSQLPNQVQVHVHVHTRVEVQVI